MTLLHLFKVAMKDLLRPGRSIVALALALAPAAIALIWRFNQPRGRFPAATVYDAFEPALVFGFILVILTVMFATGTVSQEVEQKTIVYLLTRPVARPAILLARFAAALVMVIGTTWLASIALAMATFGPGHLHGTKLPHDLLILPLGALAYGAVFLLVATVLSRPLLWGLLYVFGWESWVPTLPGYFKAGSLMAYLRVLAPHASPEEATSDITSIFSALSPSEISSQVSWIVLSLIIVLGLSGALWIFAHKEYVPRDDAV